MTDAADRLFVNGEIHTLATPDETHEAVAVRDGAVVRLGRSHEVRFLEGVDTEVIDLDGCVLLPGFVDAHTHLTTVGRYLVHADLSVADSPMEAVDLLAERAAAVEDGNSDASDGGSDDPATDWVLGYGYDESTWDDDRYLTREDLDRVSTERPVAAVREDMHVAAVNGVVLDRFADALDSVPDETVPTDDAGEPTGVLLERDRSDLRGGRTGAGGDSRPRHRCARRLRRQGDHGLSRHGAKLARSARLPRPRRRRRADRTCPDQLLERPPRRAAGGRPDDERRKRHGRDGRDQVVHRRELRRADREALRTVRGRTGRDRAVGRRPGRTGRDGRGRDRAGYQFTAHAIGDEAIDAVLDAYEEESHTDPGAARHRIEHVELADDAAIERLAETGVVASVQPNFLKWAGADGLYEGRLGPERTAETNRYRDMLDAGVHLAFGSDGMPMDPLLGVHHAVNAPAPAQRLTVTEALRAYTRARRTRASTRTGSARSSPASAPISPSSTRRRGRSRTRSAGSTWR